MLAAWSLWIHEHAAEILLDPQLHALALASRRAIGEANAHGARLSAELDRYLGRAVHHTTAAHLIATLAALPTDDLAPGTIVRCTDTGEEYEFAPGRPEGPWRARPP